MQVVVIRDVKACTQMELFSPENCLVLEMKLTVLNMCPTHPLKESIKHSQHKIFSQEFMGPRFLV